MPHTETALTSPVAAAPTAPRTGLFHRVWPAAVILLGVGLNIAWVALLGYGLVWLLMLAF